MKTALAVTFLLAPATTALADGPFLHFTGMWTKPTGTISTTGAFGPVEIELDSDLGFEHAPVWEGRGGLVFFGRNRVSVAGGIFDHDVDLSTGDFELGGNTFQATASFSNHLRWIEGEYGLTVVSSAPVKLELFAGLRLYHYTGEAMGRVTPALPGTPGVVTARAEAEGPVPHVGAAVELRPLPALVLRGMGKGFFLGVDDSGGGELDLEATAGFRLLPFLELGGGYRYFKIFVSANDGETEFDFRYQGVIAYARISS